MGPQAGRGQGATHRESGAALALGWSPASKGRAQRTVTLSCCPSSDSYEMFSGSQLPSF